MSAAAAAAGVHYIQQHHHANLTAAPVPLPLHPAAAAANHLAAAVGTARAAHPAQTAQSSTSAAEIHPLPKRMKMDLQHPAVVAAAAAQHVAAAESRNYVALPGGSQQHRPPPPQVAAAAQPPTASSSSLSTPLRIDTREAVKVRTKERASSNCPLLSVPNSLLPSSSGVAQLGIRPYYPAKTALLSVRMFIPLSYFPL